jgi:SAM-dependent methyltransferase
MSLATRSNAPERMDGLDAGPYAQCLRDLAAVNRVTFTHQPILRWLDRATKSMRAEHAKSEPAERAGSKHAESVSVLDVACGGGDLLRAIRRWADRRGIGARLEGIDLNPRSALVAQQATPDAAAITWRTGDVFAYAPEPRPDFIVSSQFAHHLDDADVVRFLAWLEAHSARGWYIADLQRHGFAHWGFPVLGRLAGWHEVVREDGRISIARSFRRDDWERLLKAAGIAADITAHMPFRLCVGRVK